jgi:hypothetical protein
MKNHNLDTFKSRHNFKITLCGNTSSFPPISPLAWLTSSAYTVDLTGIIGNKTMAHLPQTAFQYWAIVVTYSENSTGFPSTFAADPYIGRIGFAKQDDIWKMAKPIADGWSSQIRDQSRIFESEDQTIEAVIKGKREFYSIPVDLASVTEWMLAKKAFTFAGKVGDLMYLMEPTSFSSGTDAPDVNTYQTYPAHYCQFESDFRARQSTVENQNFTLPLLEIVGGTEPYGIDSGGG